jgi:hypothetical protein
MSKPSSHFLVTHPCLTPYRFAQRLTAAQAQQALQELADYLPYSDFTLTPYSQQLQRKLRKLVADSEEHVWFYKETA